MYKRQGQVTIPKPLRDKYGLDEHTEIEFVDEGGALRLVKKGRGPSHIDAVYGVLGGKGSRTDHLVKKLRGI